MRCHPERVWPRIRPNSGEGSAFACCEGVTNFGDGTLALWKGTTDVMKQRDASVMSLKFASYPCAVILSEFGRGFGQTQAKDLRLLVARVSRTSATALWRCGRARQTL